MSDTFGSIPIQPESTPAPAPKRPEPPTPKRPVRPRRHRLKPGRPKAIYLLPLLLLLVAGYLLGGFFGVPVYLQKRLPLLTEHFTGLLLQTRKVTFNPLTFDLRLEGVAVVSPKETGKPLLELQSLHAAISPFPLMKGELVATAVNLDTFHLNLVRTSESDYNFLVAGRKQGASVVKGGFDLAAIPLRFSLNNVSLTNGNLLFTDQPKNATHTVEQIQLSLPNLSNFSFQAQDSIRPSFSAIINGSPIELTGQAALTGNSMDANATLRTELSCNFNAIDLNRYFAYLPFNLPFNITNGKAEGSLKLTFTPSNKNDLLSIDFSMQAGDVRVASTDEVFQLQVPTVKLEGALQPLTGKTRLRRLEMRDPQAIIAPSFTFSHFRALANLVSPKQQSGSGSPGPEVTIDQLLADNGTVILKGDKDNELRTTWEAIQLSMKNYSNIAPASKEKQATFRLLGEQSNTRATFNLQGHINERLLPAGDMLLTNVNANTILPLIGLGDVTAAAGTVDVQGYLSFNDYPNLDIISRITVEEGVFTFNDLELVENKQTWFSAPVIKIAGFQKEGKKLSLGSVYLKNSDLHLQIEALPTIIKRIGGEKGNVAIEAMELTGKINLSDSLSKRPPLDFTEVSLQAINLARLESSSERDNLTLTARLGKSGEIQAKGKVRLSSFFTTLTTGFTGIQSELLLPWFSSSDLFKNSSMVLAGKGTFSYPFVSYTGQLLLQEGKLTRKDKSKKDVPYFSWQEINLNDFKYKSSPLQIGAAQATLLAPRTTWTYDKKSPHPLAALSDFLVGQIKENPSAEKKKESAPILELQKVAISAGAIGFTDNRLTPAWTGEIGGLNGTFDNVTSSPAAAPGTFKLNGDFESEPFSLTGKVNLFYFAKEGSAEFTVNDFPLASFRNVLKKQVDVDPSRASVSVTDKTIWGNGILRRDSQLLLTGVEPISDKADSALPLALLMGDSNRFSLHVATEQPLQNTPSSLVNDGVSTFQKLVLKSAVSPLLLANGEYEDLIGREFAEFEPGKILLTSKGQESLGRFKNLLATHPGISLTVTGSADTTLDAEAMKRDLEEAEIQRVAEENARRSAALQKASEEYLRQAAEKQKAKAKSAPVVEQKIPQELYRRYAPVKPEKVVIDKTMLQNLAKERAKIVAELFIESLSLPPERVSVAKKMVMTDDTENPGNRVLFAIGIFNTTTARQP